MPKISGLPVLSSPADDDEIAVVDDSAATTKKLTLAGFVAWLQSKIAWITTAMIADSAVTPDKRSGGYAAGIIAGATLGSTGNKTITGLGFTPKLVRFTVIPTTNTTTALMGFGAMTTSTQFYSTMAAASAAQRRNGSTSACIGWTDTTTTLLEASYVSMDSDGFTINVTTAGSNFPVAYEAYA